MPTLTTSHDYIEQIVVASSRLIRIAGSITGQTTSPAVWRTLSILRTEGPLRIGGLAEASRVSQPTMTKLLSGLVEQELVLRIADVEDSRAWLIALAPKGTAALDDYRHELGEALAPLFDGLSDSDRAALERAAEILTERSSRRMTLAERHPVPGTGTGPGPETRTDTTPDADTDIREQVAS